MDYKIVSATNSCKMHGSKHDTKKFDAYLELLTQRIQQPIDMKEIDEVKEELIHFGHA